MTKAKSKVALEVTPVDTLVVDTPVVDTLPVETAPAAETPLAETPTNVAEVSAPQSDFELVFGLKLETN